MFIMKWVVFTRVVYYFGNRFFFFHFFFCIIFSWQSIFNMVIVVNRGYFKFITSYWAMQIYFVQTEAALNNYFRMLAYGILFRDILHKKNHAAKK